MIALNMSTASVLAIFIKHLMYMLKHQYLNKVFLNFKEAL